jgi:hypothetical protein
MFAWKWWRSHEGPDPPRVPGRAAALVVGALPAWAFRAPSRWWLAWFGLTPLLLVVGAAPTAREGNVRAWWGLAGYVLATRSTGYYPAPAASLGCVGRGCVTASSLSSKAGRHGRNGSAWQVATVHALQERGRHRHRALAEMWWLYWQYMHSNAPVHTWDGPA